MRTNNLVQPSVKKGLNTWHGSLWKYLMAIGPLFISLCALDSNAQYAWTCVESPSTAGSLAPVCTAAGDAWLNTYRHQSAFVPGTNLNQGIKKTIKVAIHVWQDDLGGNNLPNTPTNVAALAEAIHQVDLYRYGSNDAPSDPISGTAFIPETYIGFELQGIYFYQNSTNNTRSCFEGYLLTPDAIAAHPEVEHCLNLHFTHGSCPASGRGEPPVFGNFAAISHVVTIFNNDYSIDPLEIDPLANHWAHELGHTLGMKHPYNSEFCSFTDEDFLYDLFGYSTPSGCTPTPSCDICYHDGGWECDVNDPGNTCTNNFMGSTKDAGYTTPLQMGRMHRALMTYSVRKYAWGYDPDPFAPSVDETWDFDIKFYQDIIVPAGITLTVACNLEMVPEAKIVVRPGGKLIVDGGKITAAQYSDGFWRGIEVWGNSNHHQYGAPAPTWQGMVVLKNGAVIEHAREGVQLWKPDDYTSMGGVIQATDATFLNCRRAVSFYSYHNFQPGTSQPRANRSYFRNVTFTVDDDYRGVDDFATHTSLWDVDGIRFIGCTFANLQTTITDSDKLGMGITSLDAGYRVLPLCSGALWSHDCPDASAQRTVFKGLDHGIHALGSGSTRAFEVDRADFKNNICGVYTSGVVGAKITRNKFVMGNRDVLLVGDEDEAFLGFHRGVYTYYSWAFAIDDNEASMDPGATAPAEAYVVGYSRDHHDYVFRNNATGVENAYVGEGICCDPGDKSTTGLEFLCNKNNGNGTDIWNRVIDVPLSDEEEDHTIRTNQGSIVRPAGNTFDRNSAPPPESDLHYNGTDNTVSYYFHDPGTTYQPTDIDATYFPAYEVTLVPAGYCASKELPPIPEGPDDDAEMLALNERLASEKTAYGNSRYLYDQLIDGGSTDEVVQEITSSWPSDAWDLRDYLLDLSPFLSTEALQEMVEKAIMPDAMVVEICAANPEATQKGGFLNWLQEESGHPVPEYMAELIVASWNTKTYRSTLEGTMGAHHAEMTQAFNGLLHTLERDTVGEPLDSLKAAWAKLRTPAARYAEALLAMQQHDYGTAATLVANIPAEHDLKAPEEMERERMLDLIDFLEGVHSNGRTIAQLSTAEQDDLESLISEANDRPAWWAQNALCFFYQRCRAPFTGADGNALRVLHASGPEQGERELSLLRIQPNPASTWVAMDHRILDPVDHAELLVRDLSGREVRRFSLANSAGQTLWDVRTAPPGAYTVELHNAGRVLNVEKLILRQ